MAKSAIFDFNLQLQFVTCNLLRKSTSSAFAIPSDVFSLLIRPCPHGSTARHVVESKSKTSGLGRLLSAFQETCRFRTALALARGMRYLRRTGVRLWRLDSGNWPHAFKYLSAPASAPSEKTQMQFARHVSYSTHRVLKQNPAAACLRFMEK